MMEAKHSPLPWSRNASGTPCRPYLVADPSNGRATHVCGVAFGEPTGGQGWPAMFKGHNYTLAIAKANADLIVRAVNSHAELLKACEAALPVLQLDEHAGDEISMIEAAIAKAKGGTS